MSEWISVKDKLPANGNKVLYYDANYKKIDCSLYDYDCFMETSRAFHNVTHWMPLPEPPNE